MNIKYDKLVDSAYISLLEQGEDASFGFTYVCEPSEVNGQIHLDFDDQGRLIGIEILQASLKLPPGLLSPRSSESE